MEFKKADPGLRQRPCVAAGCTVMALRSEMVAGALVLALPSLLGSVCPGATARVLLTFC